MKVLIIEDEIELLQNMIQSLQQEKYNIETADSFKTALDKILVYDYDCILLDIGLPDGSGLDLLKELKENKKNDSVIIISAKDSIDDKIKGLEIGADDYLTKPFHLAELNARIKAVIRRKTFEGQKTIQLGNLEIDPDGRTVSIADNFISLNRKEYDILLYFIANKNRLVSKTALAEHVWGDHTDESENFDFIYSQIKHLRKKLKAHQADIEIQAIYGIGYKLTTT